jgi:thioredoxin-like negative regulator of GroEL
VNGLEEEYRGDVYVQHIDTDNPANRRLMAEFNVSSIPRILIINDQGQISADFSGLTSEPTLRAAINKALAESVGGRPA